MTTEQAHKEHGGAAGDFADCPLCSKQRIPVYDPPDQWQCVCGNCTSDAGFYLCDDEGHEIEDTGDEWPSDLHACGHCGRIIDLDGWVVGTSD